jgi:hypothetical protein
MCNNKHFSALLLANIKYGYLQFQSDTGPGSKRDELSLFKVKVISLSLSTS